MIDKYSVGDEVVYKTKYETLRTGYVSKINNEYSITVKIGNNLETISKYQVKHTTKTDYNIRKSHLNDMIFV